MQARPPADVLAAIFEWDVRNWSHGLPLWQRHIDLHHPRRALALGERGGGLSLWLAMQGIEVVCSDLGVSFEAAQELHRRFGVGDRISYEEQDATAIGHPDGTFDLVVFKSVIGALQSKARQSTAIREMHRVLKPGGDLLFAENLVASRLHLSLRRRFVPWGREWRYVHLEDDRDLFEPFATVELETWGVVGLLGRTEGQRDLLGRLDSLLSSLVPARWRYILFGACRKGNT